MNKALEWKTNDERIKEVANRFVKARKALKISQQRLATISGVSYGSIRRFEKTGQISFYSLVCLADAINYQDDIDNLFRNITYKDIMDIIKHD